MRIITILLGVFCAFSLKANIIKNGDCSEGLKYWMRENKAIRIATDVKAGSKKAVCILPHSEIRQVVNIDRNAIYEFSFLVKGEDIPKTILCIRHFLSRKLRYPH